MKVNRLLLNNVDVVGAGWGAYVVSKPEVNRKIGAELDAHDRRRHRAADRRRALPARARRRRACG